jgi:chromosomal replication initiation ATPase DnaA
MEMESLKSEPAAMQTENKLAENYSYDQVKMYWKQFAYETKQRGLSTFYNALIKKDPIIKAEHCYELEVENQIQVDYINNHLHDLIAFLRKSLKNHHVVVELLLIDNPDNDAKFLTGKDRFALLAKKNPNLQHLKQTFNLDIEY